MNELLGTASRTKFHDARRHFESGGEVLVSEYGHEPSHPVWASTTTHTRETTTWDELVSQVRMWEGRYPNQRYYIVRRTWQPGQDVLVHGEPATLTWVNRAPMQGYSWIGYARNGVEFGGIHVDHDGRDRMGRQCIERTTTCS